MGDTTIGYKAEDVGVTYGGFVTRAQTFEVAHDYPSTPYYQLGTLVSVGVTTSAVRYTARLTRYSIGDSPATGTWKAIIEGAGADLSCAKFGISTAKIVGVTFTGRVGTPATETWTFEGDGSTTGGASEATPSGTPANTGPDIELSTGTRGASYTVTATCDANRLEEFGNADVVGVVMERPRVTATIEHYCSVGGGGGTIYSVDSPGSLTITCGDLSLALSNIVSSSYGGRGTVGGWATETWTYLCGGIGDITCGLTIS
jgi:hypothetical protein